MLEVIVNDVRLFGNPTYTKAKTIELLKTKNVVDLEFLNDECDNILSVYVNNNLSELIVFFILSSEEFLFDKENERFKQNEIFSRAKDVFRCMQENGLHFGWHDDCVFCKDVLTLSFPCLSLQLHKIMFLRCSEMFQILWKDVNQWLNGGITKMNWSCTTLFKTRLRINKQDFDEETLDQAFGYINELRLSISEDDPTFSGRFNCAQLEMYLKSMNVVATIIGTNRKLIDTITLHVLPFDFPRLFPDEKNSEIRDRKIFFSKLFSFHKQTNDKDTTFQKKFAETRLGHDERFTNNCHFTLPDGFKPSIPREIISLELELMQISNDSKIKIETEIKEPTKEMLILIHSRVLFLKITSVCFYHGMVPSVVNVGCIEGERWKTSKKTERFDSWTVHLTVCNK